MAKAKVVKQKAPALLVLGGGDHAVFHKSGNEMHALLRVIPRWVM